MAASREFTIDKNAYFAVVDRALCVWLMRGYLIGAKTKWYHFKVTN